MQSSKCNRHAADEGIIKNPLKLSQEKHLGPEMHLDCESDARSIKGIQGTYTIHK
jgi:hypothetical protein